MHPTVLAAEPGRELRWLGHLLVRGIFDGEHRWLIEEAGPGRVRFTQSERFGGILVPLLWKKLRDGGTAKGFRAMNEALARRVAESPPTDRVEVIEAPERRPRVAEAVAAAREILEREGPEGLTMRRLAEAMGIRAPSLYKHIESKEELEALLMAEAFREMGTALHEAIAVVGKRGSRRRMIAELGRAYRRWALAHPHLYRLVTGGPLPRERLPEGLEAWTAEPVVIAVGGDPDRARAAWAFAHGMTILEIDDRFPPSRRSRRRVGLGSRVVRLSPNAMARMSGSLRAGVRSPGPTRTRRRNRARPPSGSTPAPGCRSRPAIASPRSASPSTYHSSRQSAARPRPNVRTRSSVP